MTQNLRRCVSKLPESGNFTPNLSIAFVAQRRTYLEVFELIPGSCSRSGSSKLLPLLFKFFALAAFVAGMAVPSLAQGGFEVYGGYSYFRASIREGQFTGPAVSQISENANLNGWEFSGEYKYLPFFGGVVDFNGTYGKLHGASTRENTYLVGPQVSLPLKIAPFAHALFGIAHESQDAILAPACPPITFLHRLY